METNKITVPDPSSTTQYIVDPVGGWMYIVTTTVTVENKSLAEFHAKVSDAQAQLDAAQALVNELKPQAVAFATAIAAQPTPSV